jgi:hypothetical protein
MEIQNWHQKEGGGVSLMSTLFSHPVLQENRITRSYKTNETLYTDYILQIQYKKSTNHVKMFKDYHS